MNKIIKVGITVIAAFGLGIATANASSSPTLLYKDKNYFKNDGIYRFCDGHTLVYMYAGYGGISAGSFQVAMTAVKDGC